MIVDANRGSAAANVEGLTDADEDRNRRDMCAAVGGTGTRHRCARRGGRDGRAVPAAPPAPIGLSAKALEVADDVGGTWYWNRYPGARCDVQSVDYSYSFDPELDDEWEWSEKYATQPEILRYLQHVADRHDLRRDIEFSTACRWRRGTTRDAGGPHRSGDEIRCRFYVMATGCLSLPKSLDVEGAERFAGPVYNTEPWPHEGVDFTGKRVGVIGTGSSGIQSIPLIAEQAAQLTVFQRTPNFSFPAWNGPIPANKLAEIEGPAPNTGRKPGIRRRGAVEPATGSALAVSEEERHGAIRRGMARR